MIFLQMTSVKWTSIAVIAGLTLIVWVIVIFVILPRIEARVERKRMENKKRESKKRAKRIRVDSGKARIDLNHLIPKEGQEGNDEG